MFSGSNWVEIDGSLGEGGGQIVRSSLALSIISGKSIRIHNVRARRENPGLRAQHLAALDAAAAISKATVEGGVLGGTEFAFQPKEIRSGRYKFKIGTAGATTLVLQTIFLPLSLADSASTIMITGGTHVAWSPSFHYLSFQWLPYMSALGFDAKITLDQAGFYPQGRGRISATIRPSREIAPINCKVRGDLQKIEGVSAVAGLPTSIAERQKRQALLRLQKVKWPGSRPNIRIKLQRLKSQGKGTCIVLLAKFESGSCCYAGLGKLGKPAERVADEALDPLLKFLTGNNSFDEYMADQLLLPLSLSKEPSVYSTSKITNHLVTNATVVKAFLPSISIKIEGNIGQPGWVYITPGKL